MLFDWQGGLVVRKVRIGEFLFEREGRYKPYDEKIQGLKRIE